MAQAVTQIREWQVEGLDCPSCSATLEKACRGVPGVVNAQANVASGRVRLEVDDAFDVVSLQSAARRCGHPLRRDGEPPQPRLNGWLLSSAAALAAGIALEIVAASATWAYLLAALLGAAPLLPRATAALRLRSISVDVLMAVAMLGALALREWRDAALLAVLFAVAQALERASLARTGSAVASLLALAPPTARVERQGEVVEVPVGDVRRGQRIRVRPGDTIPLDGVVVAGNSAVDEATVTGESVPATRGTGDRVFAATTALDGALTIQVTHLAGASTLARVVALVEAAQAQASPTQRVVDRFARWYTPAILGLAAGVCLLGPAFGLSWAQGFERGLVLLVIGCPCAIVIATPVAVFSGLTRAARDGMLVRGGDVLEAAAGLKVVALAKTGTLTRGRLRLEQVEVLAAGGDADTVLALAAGLEAESTHPLAQAVVRAATARGLRLEPAQEHRAVPGRGVTGRVGGQEYLLGGLALLAERGVTANGAVAVCEGFEARGLTAVVLADGAAALGVLALADEVRPEAAQAVADLRAAGLTHLVMLTGDRPAQAQAIAAAVGLHEVRSELLPDGKQAVLAELGALGPTAMVGDGINDAPALASAHVGIALGAAGSDIAMETAHVALLGDDLRGVARLVRLARRVRGTIAANIALAIAIRLVLVPLALSGHASLWLAILGDMGGSLAVTANSLRLLRNTAPG